MPLTDSADLTVEELLSVPTDRLPHVSIKGEEYAPMVVSVGDMREGDYVVGTEGLVPVTQLHPVHTPDSMFELANESGDIIRLSGDHLLYTVSEADRLSFKPHARRLLSYMKNSSIFTDNVTQLASVLGDTDSEVYSYVSCCEAVAFLLCGGDTALYHNSQYIRDIERQASAVGHVAEGVVYFDGLDCSKVRKLYDARFVADNIQRSVRLLKKKRLFSGLVGSFPQPLIGRVRTVKECVEAVGIENIELPDGFNESAEGRH